MDDDGSELDGRLECSKNIQILMPAGRFEISGDFSASRIFSGQRQLQATHGGKPGDSGTDDDGTTTSNTKKRKRDNTGNSSTYHC